MTQQSIIAHIQIGAEKPFDKVDGLVKNDGTALFFYEGRNIIYFLINDSHSLSELAKTLGAKVYGGFENQKDFYLMMPTIKGLKVGDVLKGYSYNELVYINQETFALCLNKEGHCDSEDMLGFFLAQQKLNQEPVIIIDNIFEEYARTGVLQNELYKRFFK